MAGMDSCHVRDHVQLASGRLVAHIADIAVVGVDSRAFEDTWDSNCCSYLQLSWMDCRESFHSVEEDNFEFQDNRMVVDGRVASLDKDTVAVEDIAADLLSCCSLAVVEVDNILD